MDVILKRNADGSYGPEAAPAAGAGAPQTMQLASGGLGDIFKTEVAGIPIVQAGAGVALAVLLSEVVGGMFPDDPVKKVDNKWQRAGLQGIAAYIAIKYGPKYVGKDAAAAFGLFLAGQAAREALPIDKKMQELSGKIIKALKGDKDKKDDGANAGSMGAGNVVQFPPQGIQNNELSRVAVTNI